MKPTEEDNEVYTQNCIKSAGYRCDVYPIQVGHMDTYIDIESFLPIKKLLDLTIYTHLLCSADKFSWDCNCTL